MDPQGRLVYVNEAACNSLGRSRQELLFLVDPGYRSAFLERSLGGILGGDQTARLDDL